MGISQLDYFCCQRDKHMVISLMFLLLSSLTQDRLLAEGRFTKNLFANNQMIGSRPPRCERRCDSCGHCEAVQVPVTTHGQGHWRCHFIFSNIAYSRGDDVTNYKPMSWKCKCGNLIFNP